MVLIKLMRERVVQVTAASLPALLVFQTRIYFIAFNCIFVEANYGDTIILLLQLLV